VQYVTTKLTLLIELVKLFATFALIIIAPYPETEDGDTHDVPYPVSTRLIVHV
tara:strand:+ start:346 stop:504 length:159 start_codon:yes stop_codon:yes gene_type:complete